MKAVVVAIKLFYKHVSLYINIANVACNGLAIFA